MYKKTLAALIAITIILSLCSVAYAEPQRQEEIVNPNSVQYTYIASTSAAIYINSLGKASCSASINAYPGVDHVSITAYLQYYNGSWITVKSWSKDSTGIYAAMAEEWYVAQGYEYRLLVYYYAYSGSTMETTSKAVYWDYY